MRQTREETGGLGNQFGDSCCNSQEITRLEKDGADASLQRRQPSGLIDWPQNAKERDETRIAIARG